jgi:hypothetical protein
MQFSRPSLAQVDRHLEMVRVGRRRLSLLRKPDHLRKMLTLYD